VCAVWGPDQCVVQSQSLYRHAESAKDPNHAFPSRGARVYHGSGSTSAVYATGLTARARRPAGRWRAPWSWMRSALPLRRGRGCRTGSARARRTGAGVLCSSLSLALGKIAADAPAWSAVRPAWLPDAIVARAYETERCADGMAYGRRPGGPPSRARPTDGRPGPARALRPAQDTASGSRVGATVEVRQLERPVANMVYDLLLAAPLGVSCQSYCLRAPQTENEAPDFELGIRTLVTALWPSQRSCGVCVDEGCV
jgi:hypothetical protein